MGGKGRDHPDLRRMTSYPPAHSNNSQPLDLATPKKAEQGREAQLPSPWAEAQSPTCVFGHGSRKEGGESYT